jgi:enoyl-CoA hydratase
VATARSVVGVPAAKLGLVIDGWTIDRIRSEFGTATARGMLLAAETYTGERLYGSGAVHRLGDLDAALAWAGQIASLAPLSITGHKIGLDVAHAGGDRFAAAQQRDAFLDKRPATFRGR